MTEDDRKAVDASQRVVHVCDVIAQIVSHGEAAFLADVQARWAAEMGLIRIGEAVAKIPAVVRERHPGQPWRQIIDMRNFAARQNDDLDPRRVWRTLTRDVPHLRAYLETVIIGTTAETQRVTPKDVEAGQLRVPSRSKRLFPSERARVVVEIDGVQMPALWDPRRGPDRERSGVIRIGRSQPGAHLTAGSSLRVEKRDDVYVIGDPGHPRESP